MEQAILKAVEGGFIAPAIISTLDYWNDEMNNPSEAKIYARWVIMQLSNDPLFWQALSKALGWDTDAWFYNNMIDGMIRGKEYLEMWHRFIDHLDSGKDPDSFFNNLLK